ncbi:hypothetical protein GCM10010530_59110 [Kribbella aluminosa]
MFTAHTRPERSAAKAELDLLMRLFFSAFTNTDGPVTPHRPRPRGLHP